MNDLTKEDIDAWYSNSGKDPLYEDYLTQCCIGTILAVPLLFLAREYKSAIALLLGGFGILSPITFGAILNYRRCGSVARREHSNAFISMLIFVSPCWVMMIRQMILGGWGF